MIWRERIAIARDEALMASERRRFPLPIPSAGIVSPSRELEASVRGRFGLPDPVVYWLPTS